MDWEPRYPSTGGKFRTSPSSLEGYLRCGIAHEFRRESREKRATVRMVIGSAVAAGARVDNLAKIQTGTGRRISEIVETSVSEYEKEVAETEIPESKAEVHRGKDSAAEAARVFAKEASPKIQGVIEAERPIVADLGDLELAGTPDYTLVAGVGDLKTGQPWNQERVDRSRQLTAYAILHRARHGHYPRRVWIDSVYRRGNEWRYERIWSHRTERDVAAFVDTLERARKAMVAGVALPAPENAWYCSKEWCEWFRVCPAVANKK